MASAETTETVPPQFAADELRAAIGMLDHKDLASLFHDAAFQSAVAGGERSKALLDTFMLSPVVMYCAAQRFVQRPGSPAAAYAAALQTLLLLRTSGYDGVPAQSLRNVLLDFHEPSLAVLACKAMPSIASAVQYIHAFFEDDAVVDCACDVLLTAADAEDVSALVSTGALTALARAFDRRVMRCTATPIGVLARFIKCFNRCLKCDDEVGAVRRVLTVMDASLTSLNVFRLAGVTDDIALDVVELLTALKIVPRHGHIAVQVAEEMERRKADAKFVSAACLCLRVHVKLEPGILQGDDQGFGGRFQRALLQTFKAFDDDLGALSDMARVIRRVARSTSSCRVMQSFVDAADHFGVITKLVVLLRRINADFYTSGTYNMNFSWAGAFIKTLAAIAKHKKQHAVVAAGGIEVLVGITSCSRGEDAYLAHAVCEALHILTEHSAACALVAQLGGIRVLGKAYAAHGDSKSHNVSACVLAAMTNIEAWRSKV